jgi:hypothetical protein
MAPSPGGASDQPRRRTVSDVKIWVEEITTTHIINQQDKIINFLLGAYGGLLLATMVIFYLQGFNARGFNLDGALLKWLGGAAIGEIAGLLTLTIGAILQKAKGWLAAATFTLQYRLFFHKLFLSGPQFFSPEAFQALLRTQGPHGAIIRECARWSRDHVFYKHVLWQNFLNSCSFGWYVASKRRQPS